MKKAAYLGLCNQSRTAHAGKEYATMDNRTSEPYRFPASTQTPADPLTEVLRRGARQMLIQAVEAEAAEWIDAHAHVTDERGRRQVVRNGHAAARKVLTGVGPLQIAMPRVHDRRPPSQGKQRFTSKIRAGKRDRSN
jgi:hypothetical protein